MGLGKTIETHESDETVLILAGSEHEYVSMPMEICINSFLERSENIRVEGNAFEVDNLDFNFYLLTETNYKLWETGKSYIAYFEGRAHEKYDFSIIPSSRDLCELLLLVEGENRGVRITVTVQWEGVRFFGIFSGLMSLMFFVYSVPCIASGLILILLFKRGKKVESQAAR